MEQIYDPMTIKSYSLTFFIYLLLSAPGFSQDPIQPSVHLKDQNFNSGNNKILAYDSISMTNVMIGSGADLTLRSLNMIILNPGVDISQDATFQVYADMELISRLIEEGNSRASLGDYDGAIAKFEQVLEIYPGHALANYTLGLLHDKKGDSGTAISYLEKVLLLVIPTDPLVPQTHYLLGLWKFPSDPYNFHFDKVLELVSPNDPLALMVKDARINYHLNSGGSLFRDGNLNGAIMEFQRVLQIDPDHPQAHFQLGVCYVEIDRALARYYLQRFIVLAPDDPEAETAREMLSYL